VGTTPAESSSVLVSLRNCTDPAAKTNLEVDGQAFGRSPCA